MECEFCHKTFSNKSNLKMHQLKAKYCLKLQTATPENIHMCSICEKTFNVKSSFERHEKICKSNPTILKNEIEELKKTILDQKEHTLKIELEHKDDTLKNALLEIEGLKEELKALQKENIQKIEDENNRNKKKIDNMTKKYVKKHARVQYEVPNVIYILTTPSLKKDRRYILGKAGNLTDRLSTYNKTDEHEVMYYQGCVDLDNMALVESFVFHKLKEYREQANRERFVLPEGVSIEMFIEVVKRSVESCK